jgi:hypothetical protein
MGVALGERYWGIIYAGETPEKCTWGYLLGIPPLVLLVLVMGGSSVGILMVLGTRITSAY